MKIEILKLLIYHFQVKAGAMMNLACILVVTIGIHSWGWWQFKLHERPWKADHFNSTTMPLNSTMLWNIVMSYSAQRETMSKCHLPMGISWGHPVNKPMNVSHTFSLSLSPSFCFSLPLSPSVWTISSCYFENVNRYHDWRATNSLIEWP